MNNIHDLAHTVNTPNTATLPAVYEYFANLGFHVGEYKWSARSNDFGSWYLCDGRALPIADYQDLYNIIGTAFGSNSATTFKLPDLRGRVFGCAGSAPGLTPRSIGDVVGTEKHILTTDELPAHSHIGTTASNGSHNHTGSTSITGNHSHTVTDPGHTHTQTTINDDFNNSGTSPPGFTADSAGSVTWSNINYATTGISINSNGDHSHTIPTDGSHAHTFTTSSVGGGIGHNNMQPTAFVGNTFIYVGYRHVVRT